MREIKFRAWNHEMDRYEYYGVVQFEGSIVSDWGADKYDWIVEQFTGLLDKNGKEIYEGDIIQDSTFKDRGSYIMAVEWEKEAASFVLTRKGWAFRHYFYESCDPNDCEVIGNIYESPELLKETK